MVLEVFLSYAHQDQQLRREFDAHLSNLKRQGVISSWSDYDVVSGAKWRPQIMNNLNTAKLILLLISADFIASEFCYSIEMTRAIERHKANEARVLPIIVRPCDWKEAPFAELEVLPTGGRAVTRWPSLDGAFADVVQGIRRAIDDLAKNKIRDPLWMIPYPHNAFFTGREALLARLATALRPGQATALSLPVAISGLGGMGKTQLVLEYAYRHHQDYQAVFWVRADTRENLVSDFVAMARRLQLPEQDARDAQQTVAAVQAWLITNDGWLLILDNADDLAFVREFLPPSL
jgi:TIR domain